MWVYEKKLEYPVCIKSKDLKMAQLLLTQYGGPSGELSASLQYLTQRYTMPTEQTKALLTDIGTEELAHVEIIATMVYQIMSNATPVELKAAGLDKYYVLHGKGLFYTDPNGYNWTADYISCKGDAVVDLTRDMAAEEEARISYEYLINQTNDQSILDPLIFLREREIVHHQRFGEALVKVRDLPNCKVYL